MRKRSRALSICLMGFIFWSACVSPASSGNISEIWDDYQQVKDLLDAAEEAGRALTPAEQAEIDGLVEEVEASVEEEAEEEKTPEVIEAAIKVTITTIDGILKGKKDDLRDMAKDELSESKEKLAKDHDPLEEEETVWNDMTGQIDGLFESLSAADALTFAAAADFERRFEEKYPGYKAPDSGDFSGEFKERVNDWQNYAFAELGANNFEALDAKENLQEFMDKLNGASLSAYGYTQLLQARNQIYLFAAEEVLNLRLDVVRRIEARARFISNREQKKIDGRVAFEQAVNEWRAQSGGRGY
jgi:P-type conjugative transfer protein TrbJ